MGVPITVNKLNKLDCRLLVEKATNKITIWVTKSTSYAGRVALINSALMGIYSFGATMFILTKGVIKEVEIV